MKNFYEILGVDQGATLQAIRKAYHTQALRSHPDKQGGSKEKFNFLHEAYATLSDPNRRKDYEKAWEVYSAAGEEKATQITISDYLTFDGLPYSHKFRRQHESFIKQFTLNPLEAGTIRPWFTSFSSNHYPDTTGLSSPKVASSDSESKPDSKSENGTNISHFNDIYSYINSKPLPCQTKIPDKLCKQSLTPTKIITIFIDFLKGHYYGETLKTINEYLAIESGKITHIYNRDQLLYQGILKLLSTTKTDPNHSSHLLQGIAQITQYAKHIENDTIKFAQLVPLLHNKYFRNLFSYALHVSWQDNKSILNSEILQTFNGQEQTKHVLNELVEKLTSNSVREEFRDILRELIQLIKLLYEFEKADVDENSENKAKYYREKAFQMLDWIPVFSGKAIAKIMVNLLLQVGIHFQKAAIHESNISIAMADEKLASIIYLNTIGIGEHAIPDVELYAYTHLLKCMAGFQFKDPDLAHLIPLIQKRALVLADLFPFYDPLQSNISLYDQYNDSISLMRNLLHALVDIIEHNKKHPQAKIAIDHDEVTVLYFAYEACLKNWYERQANDALEHKFRLDLMEALLREKQWTFEDVEENLAWPWVMIDRDDQGWMKPSRTLAFPEDPVIEKFSALEGFEIDHKTGKITISLQRLDAKEDGDYPHHQAFTLLDLSEMLELNLQGGVFSLDPVDPNKPYHPFNKMYFSPSRLHESELLNSMLLTDYILKFLTINQEVQGNYPYARRPLDQMISHLPLYLRNIIYDFHREQRSGMIHRFWIEADEINVFAPKTYSNRFEEIVFDQQPMVVKKHQMRRDMAGNLVDTDKDEEGWPIYVFAYNHEWDKNNKAFQDHAIVYIGSENKLYFLEDNQIKSVLSPETRTELLNRLYKQPREQDGKIIIARDNAHLIFRVTKEVTAQAGLSHRYSPEFIFAHEFTSHYNEFGLYLPEFARLRELSKILIMIRMMNGIRSDNKEKLQALNHILGNGDQVLPDTQCYKSLKKDYNRVYANLESQFKDWSKALSYKALFEKWNDELSNVYSITFGNKDRKSALFQASASIRCSYSPKDITKLIEDYLKFEIEPLVNALVIDTQLREIYNIMQKFPEASIHDIKEALNGSSDAITRIATIETKRQFRELQTAAEKLENNFVELGLGKREQTDELDLAGECLWVPASVGHETSAALAQSRFIVYGGVKLQAKVNVLPQGGPGGRPGNPPPIRYSGGGSLFNPTGSTTAAAWSTKARLKAAKLPTQGKIRFVPQRNYSPSEPLRKGDRGGFIDRFGNEWQKGSSRTIGHTFEWDVQLSNTGRAKLGWASKNGQYLNVSQDGRFTHR